MFLNLTANLVPRVDCSVFQSDTMGKNTRSTNKARVYYCQTCKTRHTAPTGVDCLRTPEQGSRDPETDSSTGHRSEGDSDVVENVSRKGLQTPRATEECPAAGRSDTDLILAKIAELQAQTSAQCAADKAEFNKAIQTLTARIEAPLLSSEDEERDTASPTKVFHKTPAGAGRGARPKTVDWG